MYDDVSGGLQVYDLFVDRSPVSFSFPLFSLSQYMYQHTDYDEYNRSTSTDIGPRVDRKRNPAMIFAQK